MLSMPTPNPLMIRPTTIVPYPLQKVCTAPPMVKTKAPDRRVRRRPYVSARYAASKDVTKP